MALSVFWSWRQTREGKGSWLVGKIQPGELAAGGGERFGFEGAEGLFEKESADEERESFPFGFLGFFFKRGGRPKR